MLTSELSVSAKNVVNLLFALVTLAAYVSILYLYLNRSDFRSPGQLNTTFVVGSFLMLYFMSKAIFGSFHMINELTHYFRTSMAKSSSDGITRSKFLTTTGLALASLPLVIGSLGIFRGRFNFKVIRNVVESASLPASWDGKKIVQLSDLHIGSFPVGHPAVIEAIEAINKLEADYIFFTGDLVNDTMEEAESWISALSKLKAKSGKYSVLGNHDYGDYIDWKTEEDKIRNANGIKDIHSRIGFQLLQNENILLDEDGQSVRLIGIENWGAGRFSKYGDLSKAIRGSNDSEFQILLSHDPSHWDAQVLKHTSIDLSLAGHTHGFQLGIEIPGVKWSPVQYRYPRWAGLYKEGSQHLYVNRGFGYIGYAGRVGVPPEITEITLRRTV